VVTPKFVCAIGTEIAIGGFGHEGPKLATISMTRLLVALLGLVIVCVAPAFGQPRDVESLRNRYFVVADIPGGRQRPKGFAYVRHVLQRR
jgi:hypothetical protein